MKKPAYVAMCLHDGETNAGKVELPIDCLGLLFVFRTKEAGCKFWGETVTLTEIRLTGNESEEETDARA